MPSPIERKPVLATQVDSGEAIEISCDKEKPFSAQVFKTVVDPFVGKLNMLRVFTGTLKSGMTVYNSTTGEKEKIFLRYRVQLLAAEVQEKIPSHWLMKVMFTPL